MTTDLPGLPEPPDLGASALPAGTFDGTAVFITGGGTGLGKAIALEFARLGASIVIASRKPEHLEAGHEAVAALGAPVTTVACDIREPEQIAAAFDAAEAAYGLPGVLINNAAANFPVPAEDMSPNAWRTVVDITLNGTFFCSREFARRHLAAGTPGSIVNVGASYAWTGGPGFAHSAAAKAGVKNMVETLAVEWGPYGIQVNGLVPGLFPHEDMTADIKGNLDRTNEKDVAQPALRVGQLRELGWAATFLASPYARFISGHTLVVDGANWQRRALTNPPVVTVREQMGKGPFGSEPVIVDTHVHVIAPDEARYPLRPSGVGSQWFRDHPVSVERVPGDRDRMPASTGRCWCRRTARTEPTTRTCSTRLRPPTVFVSVVIVEPGDASTLRNLAAVPRCHGVRLFGIGVEPPTWFDGDGGSRAVGHRGRARPAHRRHAAHTRAAAAAFHARTSRRRAGRARPLWVPRSARGSAVRRRGAAARAGGVPEPAPEGHVARARRGRR